MSSEVGGSEHLHHLNDAVQFIEDFDNQYRNADENSGAEGYTELVEKINTPEFSDAIDFIASAKVEKARVENIKKAVALFGAEKSQQEKVAQVTDPGFWNRLQQFHDDMAALTRDDTWKKIKVNKSEGSGF